MTFKNYQIFVFDEKTGSRHSFRFRGLFICLATFVVLLLLAGNILLGKYFFQTRAIEGQLISTERNLEGREVRLIGLLAELDSLREDIYRIRQFDNKLRVLVGDGAEEENSSMGGVPSESFDVDMLPLHRQELAARKIHSFINDLKKDVQLEELVQQDLLLYMRENAQRLSSTPSIWPVQGFISSKFGMRSSPFTGVRQLHRGIDIAALKGTPIYAPASGRVVFAQTDGGYGLSIHIDHGSGIVTRYAHMDKLHVKKGDVVQRGIQIGDVGNTGRSTGPHLHYEVLVNSVPTNPLAYILQN